MRPERFAPCASRLAGIAGVLLGWRPEEFWSATPTELQSIFEILTGDDAHGLAAGGADLARMMELFPDG